MSASDDQAWVILNGRRVAAEAAAISPLSEGFLFGLGLFETIKVLGGRPLFFAEHEARLRRGAAALGLSFATSAEVLRARCLDCVAANRLVDGALKVVLFQDTAGAGELVLTRSSTYQSNHYERGFWLQTARDGTREDGICGLKTLSYLKALVARRAAQAAGFDEALFVDGGGRVLEGAASNVFAVKAGKVFTPGLDQGILPGVTRSLVLRLLERDQVREGVVPESLFLEADEVFVTSALLGVMPVSRIGERRYDVRANPMTKALMEGYRALEAHPGPAA